MQSLVPKTPSVSAKLARKGVIPAAFLAALSSPLAHQTLERWEGNILYVYADHLAYGLPTYCAGRTDWKATVGTQLTDDQCRAVNKVTLLEYGFAVLECADWNYLTPTRLVALTIFAVNVGKVGACNSQAVKAINSGDIAGGCKLLAYKLDGSPNWAYAGGRFVQGLHNRRKAEYSLCLRKE